MTRHRTVKVRPVSLLVGAALWTLILAFAPEAAVAQTRCSIEVNRVASLGQLDDPISLTQPTHLDVSPLPRAAGWALVDGEGKFVARYSREGEFQGRLLTPGHGPGEIEGPVRVFIDETDSLWVSADRGRAVVLGNDGRVGRTLTAAEFVAVDGETPSSHLYSVRASPEITPDGGFGVRHLHADVMDRNGRFLLRAGPAAALAASALSPTSFAVLQPYRLVPTTDSTFLSPAPWGDEDTWMARWTTLGVDRLLSGEAVRQFLEAELGVSLQSLERSRHIRAGRDGAVWLIGSVRAMPAEDAAALRREVARSLELEPNDVRMLYHPSILNRTQTGILLLVTPEGEIISGTLLDHYLRGFIDESHLFSLEEDELGLLQVVIWRFRRACG